MLVKNKFLFNNKIIGSKNLYQFSKIFIASKSSWNWNIMFAKALQNWSQQFSCKIQYSAQIKDTHCTGDVNPGLMNHSMFWVQIYSRVRSKWCTLYIKENLQEVHKGVIMITECMIFNKKAVLNLPDDIKEDLSCHLISDIAQ